MKHFIKLLACLAMFFAPIFLLKIMGLVVGYSMQPWDAMYFGSFLGSVAMIMLALVLFVVK